MMPPEFDKVKSLFCPPDETSIYIAVESEGNWSQNKVSREKFENLKFSEFFGKEDVYWTLNPFSKEAKSNSMNQVTHIRRFYLDFDCGNHDLPIDEVESIALTRLQTWNFPRPSFKILSGRGFWFVWDIEDAPADFSVRHRFCVTSKAFVELFKDLGADPHCTNPNRFCRLPGSVNSKNGETVRVEFFKRSKPKTFASFCYLIESASAVSSKSILQEAMEFEGHVKRALAIDAKSYKSSFISSSGEENLELVGEEEFGQIVTPRFEKARGLAIQNMIISHIKSLKPEDQIGKGNRQNFMFHMANALSLQGVSFNDSWSSLKRDILSRMTSTSADKAEWKRTVKSAFRYRARNKNSPHRGYAFSVEAVADYLGISQNLAQLSVKKYLLSAESRRKWSEYLRYKEQQRRIRKNMEVRNLAIYAAVRAVSPFTGKPVMTQKQVGDLFNLSEARVSGIMHEVGRSNKVHKSPSELVGDFLHYVQAFFWKDKVKIFSELASFYQMKDWFWPALPNKLKAILDLDWGILFWAGLVDLKGDVVAPLR